ncbi:MAG: anti-sigma factor domain-containing protein [Bacilli bacterium]
MSRGIVMEFADERTAIVLTSDFGFVRVERRAEMAVGGEIELPQGRLRSGAASRRPAVTRRRPFYLTAGALAASLLAAAVITFSRAVPAAAAPYVYVSVDINPSVEFTVNKAQRVVAVTALDADGALALDQLSMVGDSLGGAVQSYLHELLRLGMVRSHASVIVTSAGQNGASENALAGVIQQVDNEVKTTLGSKAYHLVSFSVRKRVFKTALDYHVTPGRLALYIEAKRAGQPVSWSDIVQGHLAKALGGEKQLTDLLDRLQHDTSLNTALQDVTEAAKTAESRAKTKTVETKSAGAKSRATAKAIAEARAKAAAEAKIEIAASKLSNRTAQGVSDKGNTQSLARSQKSETSVKASQDTPPAPLLPADLPPLPPQSNGAPQVGVSAGSETAHNGDHSGSAAKGSPDRLHRPSHAGNNREGNTPAAILRNRNRGSAEGHHETQSVGQGQGVKSHPGDGSAARAAHGRKGRDHKRRGHGNSDHGNRTGHGGDATHTSHHHQGGGSGITVGNGTTVMPPSGETSSQAQTGSKTQTGHDSSSAQGNDSTKSSISGKRSGHAHGDRRQPRHGSKGKHKNKHESNRSGQQQGGSGGIGVAVGPGAAGGQSDGAPQQGGHGNGSGDGSGVSVGVGGISIGIGTSAGHSGHDGPSQHQQQHHHQHHQHHHHQHQHQHHHQHQHQHQHQHHKHDGGG